MGGLISFTGRDMVSSGADLAGTIACLSSLMSASSCLILLV